MNPSTPSQIIQEKEKRANTSRISSSYRSFKKDFQNNIWTGRWTPSKKELIIKAIELWIDSLQELEKVFRISNEEFLNWKTAYDKKGEIGLQVNQIHTRRSVDTLIG